MSYNFAHWLLFFISILSILLHKKKLIIRVNLYSKEGILEPLVNAIWSTLFTKI